MAIRTYSNAALDNQASNVQSSTVAVVATVLGTIGSLVCNSDPGIVGGSLGDYGSGSHGGERSEDSSNLHCECGNVGNCRLDKMMEPDEFGCKKCSG